MYGDPHFQKPVNDGSPLQVPEMEPHFHKAGS